MAGLSALRSTIAKIDIVQLRDRTWRFAQSERGRDAICLALVFALVSVMLRRCLHGDPPVGHDHPVHLFRIWQFGHTLLHHPFSPWTWSHRWFAGYPQNVVYPIGADLLVLAVKALSLNFLSLAYAYAVAFFIFYFVYGAAVFLFVRRALESRTAALFAVLFLLTDPGSNDTGGWFYTVDVGVWAGPLGVAPMLVALVQINALFEQFDRRRLVLAAVCMAAAILCHPLHIIFIAIALPLLCLCRYIAGEPTPWTRAVIAIAVALALALLIASYWLVPYIAASPYALDVGQHGDELRKIGDTLSSAKFFDRMNPYAAAAGLIGVVCLLAARRTLALFMSIFAFIAIVLSSTTFAALLGPHAAAWIEKHIIATRLLMLAKPFWYGAAGFVFVAAGRAIVSLGKNQDDAIAIPAEMLRAAILALIVAVLVAPLGYYFISAFIKSEVKRPSVWLSDRTDRKARADFIDWAHRTLDRQSGFFRIAHSFDWNDHDLADLAIALPYPFYKIGPTPTGHFKFQLYSSTNATFRAINVRFAISHTPLPPRADLHLRENFRGKLYLYEFTNWNPSPFEITGTGPVDLVTFGEDEIVLRAGAGASGSLRLNVSFYPKWRATIDDAPVPMTIVEIPGIEHSAFMQVPLRPGTIRFRFCRGVSDYIGTLFSFIGLAGCAILLKSERAATRMRLSI